jgi:OOP family OmpA-OmpF porin
MRAISNRTGIRLAVAALALSAPASVYAQDQAQSEAVTITGSQMTAGPDIKGVITARNDNKLKVTAADGTSTVVAFDGATKVATSGGLFATRKKLTTDSLFNGLPVTIKTQQPRDELSGGELVASRITFRNNDLKVASMIHNGTAQRFEEQTAATEALKGRVGDIDKYNVKATTNVHFAVGRTDLSEQAKAELCRTANSAEATENALLLVLGYTDSTGSDDLNQELSEKRASRVINYLQQQCGWKPYRMLTPAGMAKADPVASNDTPDGKALNRRVAVNVLVSKSVDGL